MSQVAKGKWFSVHFRPTGLHSEFCSKATLRPCLKKNPKTPNPNPTKKKKIRGSDSAARHPARDTLVAYWRQAGLSYIRFSQICAKAVRDALKTEFKANAEKTSGSSVKIVKVKKEQPALTEA
uniref:ATP synthase F(1) complex subunit epsilon, mitochondrial n=1 Tax=Peromyscus maniculatus bairdii TaxID=230844 RepID=A0A8C8UMQ1_PERMB